MEALLLIVFFGFLVFVGIVVVGHIKGAPDPATMDIQAIIARIQSEEAWVNKYHRLDPEFRQGEGIKNQYKSKSIYIRQLQLEYMKRMYVGGGGNVDQSVIPIMERELELLKQGVDEATAKQQSVDEYIARRDENKSAENNAAPVDI